MDDKLTASSEFRPNHLENIKWRKWKPLEMDP